MSGDATGHLVSGRRRSAELGVLVVAAVVGLVAGYWWLSGRFSQSAGLRWLAPTGAVLAYVGGFLWRHRATLPRVDGTRLGALGLANHVTLFRAGLLAGVAGFALVDPAAGLRWLPALGYGAVVALDAVDGAVARSVGTETRLGERLDMATDTTGFLVAPLVAVAWGLLPAWYLSLSAARYVYRAGCWLHRRRGGAVGDLPPSRVRRPLAALQMGFLTVALAPAAPTPLVRLVAPAVLLPSLAVFARDLVAVTRPQSEE
ncbi:CDP-alcohol phosphatidyltransferase family protein [Haloarcula litorea]|uniref:CDP-alcohol phosphatidyltransferase family protein n=1 Tax=Haloarcula litorea TaxID=3032579 RepID=UPI0023E80030|nr:CDP-alcohol phosphatidyltransferase family protein [Halomicroarcula sp. GDY20]